MRWKVEPRPKVGDKKTVTKFLLFPKKVNHEYRWFEKVTMNMQYVLDYETYFASWIATRFVDKGEETE